MLRQHDARLPEQHFQKIRSSCLALETEASIKFHQTYWKSYEVTSNSEQHSSAHAEGVYAEVTKFILRQSFKQFQVDFVFNKKF